MNARIDNARVERFEKSHMAVVSGIEYKGSVTAHITTAGIPRMIEFFQNGRKRADWNTDHVTWDEIQTAAIDAIEYDDDMSGREQQRQDEWNQAMEEQSEAMMLHGDEAIGDFWK